MILEWVGGVLNVELGYLRRGGEEEVGAKRGRIS